MLQLLKSLIRSLRDRVFAARDPIGFARSLGVRVGKNVRFYGVSRAMFGSEPWMISIGNDCYITAGVQFINHDGGTLILRKEEPTLEWTAPISIGNDVYIGVRTIILPNVRIGNRCIVGAGSIVSRSIPDNSVYAGIPARFICSTDDYLAKMKAKSLACGHLPGNQKAEVIKQIYRDRGWFAK
ncbi:similar to Protein capG, involved in capsular polysaccharide (CPS) biosynthesis [Aromatoleum aromaticum EbN1]|uniref:Similar to Protein capG, involved in capsular polysaccharide (CPS) biosynthesis n=1 Tax=Aromatoleum aromaticum (strain DSM 19018 / LMG 30748 / EbN1) TaxID=76114 RepID=Q5NZP5_AROAE|nr:acyltransferase [Aromatoleum aromaticum]CAI09469.1 similar to Protein capG, involved in capsular polysaccharide (CPS) biosynthesis [Aromatoleum aromaticum EbN1]